MKKPFHGPRVAGGDFHILTFTNQFFDPFVFAGRHFAKVGNAFEGFPGIAEPFEHLVFDVRRNNLREGAAAVENLGGGGAQGVDPGIQVFEFRLGKGRFQWDFVRRVCAGW